MGLKCYFALFLLATLTAAQTTPRQADTAQDGGQIIDEALLEAKEASILKQDFERDFNSWVLEELTTSEQNSRFQSTESFLLQLTPAQQHEFRWPIQTKQAFLQLKLRVFTQESGDDIVIIKNPSEDSRVEVSARTTLDEQYSPLANVYLQKVIKVKPRGDGVFIQLTNTHSITVIAQVSLQGEPAMINPALIAKNDELKVPTVKLEAMLGEMRVTESNRKWQYKWQWGFLQREEHYESEMLKLIGGETVIILATAVVQMYCIKALLDNNRIV